VALTVLLIVKAPTVAAVYDRFCGKTQEEAIQPMFWLTLALAVWITHNMVDINVYFGSVGALGAIIIGTMFARRQAPPEPARPWQVHASIAFTTTIALAMVLFSGINCVASELQQRAQVEFDNKKLTTALETLNVARKVCPINSSLHHDTGEVLL